MKRVVVWTSSARRELFSIVRYIKSDNPRAAADVSRKLRAIATGLGGLPSGRPGRVGGTYEKSTPGLPYILAYELVPYGSGEAVTILHVIHTARDWPRGQWPSES